MFRLPDGPVPEWSIRMDPLGYIPTLNDALFMAEEIAANDIQQGLPLFPIHILQLLPGNVPDIDHPVEVITPHRPA